MYTVKIEHDQIVKAIEFAVQKTFGGLPVSAVVISRHRGGKVSAEVTLDDGEK